MSKPALVPPEEREPARVSAVVLAAGGSTRFGGPKLLAPLDWAGGRPMIRVVVERVLGADVAEVIVVTGCEEAKVQQALAGLPIRIAPNPERATGLSSSLRAGLSRLSAGSDAALFVLGDQPGVSTGVLDALIARYRAVRTPIVAPVCRGRRGNPALFDRCTFDALRRIEGDQGGRALIDSGCFVVDTVQVDDPSILWDVDRPEDLRAPARPRE